MRSLFENSRFACANQQFTEQAVGPCKPGSGIAHRNIHVDRFMHVSCTSVAERQLSDTTAYLSRIGTGKRLHYNAKRPYMVGWSMRAAYATENFPTVIKRILL